MYCKKCGENIDLDVQRCKRCGRVNEFYRDFKDASETQTLKLSAASAVRASSPDSIAKAVRTHAKKKTKGSHGGAVMSISLIVIAALVFAVIFAFNSYGANINRGRKSEEKGRYAEAAQYYVRAANKKKHSSEAYVSALNAYSHDTNTDIDGIINVYRAAKAYCEDISKVTEALKNLSQSYLDGGAYVSAVRAVKGAYEVSGEQSMRSEWDAVSKSAVERSLKELYAVFGSQDKDNSKRKAAMTDKKYLELYLYLSDGADMIYVPDDPTQNVRKGVGVYYVERDGENASGEQTEEKRYDSKTDVKKAGKGNIFYYYGYYLDGKREGYGNYICYADENVKYEYDGTWENDKPENTEAKGMVTKTLADKTISAVGSLTGGLWYGSVLVKIESHESDKQSESNEREENEGKNHSRARKGSDADTINPDEEIKGSGSADAAPDSSYDSENNRGTLTADSVGDDPAGDNIAAGEKLLQYTYNFENGIPVIYVSKSDGRVILNEDRDEKDTYDRKEAYKTWGVAGYCKHDENDVF